MPHNTTAENVAKNPATHIIEIAEKLDRAFCKLASSESFTSFELTPLVGAEILTSSAQKALRHCTLFDSFVCTDSPLARFKPSSILSSIRLQELLHTPLICTLSMRDRNSIALCGEILGANSFGLRAFLSLTGDPIKLGNTESKAVFEDNSLKLNAIITQLNCGIDITGKPLSSAPSRIYNCNVINAYAPNPKTLQNKMERKITSAFMDSGKLDSRRLDSGKLDSTPPTSLAHNQTSSLQSLGVGLSAFFSQPTYSTKSAELLLEHLAIANHNLGTNVSLVLGFFPVVSYRAAVFLRDKLPGVFIPDAWIARLEKAHHSQDPINEERKIGLELSRELYGSLKAMHNKFHIMTNGNLSLAEEILQA